MEACGAGYLVNDCQKALQKLCAGDIIVAIEEELLIDLDEDKIEEIFGQRFQDGATLLVGSFEELQFLDLEVIRRKAMELLAQALPAQQTEPKEAPKAKAVQSYYPRAGGRVWRPKAASKD